MNVAKRITDLRLLKGYTVNKLASRAGISQSYLRDIELEKKNPTVEVLSYICDALDISLKDFFDEQFCNRIDMDPLIQQIYQLTPEQQRSLLSFLNTINHDK